MSSNASRPWNKAPWRAPAVCLFLLLAACSCTTPPAPPAGEPLTLEIKSPALCAWDGQDIPIADLPKALRAARIPVSTPIVLEIPASLPASAMREWLRRLSDAGYRAVMFKRPRQAGATVKPGSSRRGF